MAATKVDVLILGGGAAGIAAAQALARQLHTAVVFNSGVFRNARTKHMHNVSGWDHRDPVDFRAKARADLLARYHTIKFRDVEVTSIKKVSGEDESLLFEAVDVEGQKFQGRRVIMANGIKDIMPDISGFSDLWGRSIFHCLFCHGYEERGAKSAGVLATGFLTNPAFSAPVTRMAGRLAEVVNVYTNGNESLASELRPLLKNTKKFHIINDKISSLAKDPEVGAEHTDILVSLEGGAVKKEGFMVHLPAFELNGPFAKDLGLKLTPMGHIEVSAAPMFTTSEPGVSAAGDCATMIASVATASYMGSCVAAGIVHGLQAEDDVAPEE